MLIKICIASLLIAAAPLWSQVGSTTTSELESTAAHQDESATTATASDPDTSADSTMLLPPPVSGAAYPATGSEETRSNYLRGAVSLRAGYTDNAFMGSSGPPTRQVNYSIWPSVALDKSTSRLHTTFTYSPGFTFYQDTEFRNGTDHYLGADFQYRLSPHVAVRIADSFGKTSNVFNQPDFASTDRVFGSAQAPTVVVVAPTADQLTNAGNVEITYQYGLNGMLGASGSFIDLHYSDLVQVPGLFNSNSKGGSAFYNRRLSKKQYVGLTYQYQATVSSSVGAQPVEVQNDVQTQTLSGFYTFYFKPTLSLSVTGGPQLTQIGQFGAVPGSREWSPSLTASFGWQGRRTSLATSYSRLVTSGGGLIGAFHANSANVSMSWQCARTWSIGLGGTYSMYRNLEPFLLLTNPGGHTLSGSGSVRHQLGAHLNLEAGYIRLHQTYSNIAVVSTTPDANSEFLSISYQFVRGLGR